ncbi:Cup9p KNAG_0M00500 [Huiozyma naganishii CBS 8797]|uniref:Homeobox domain-containing protein n=1 Tax=Huiozyma naganishii (strain ATCC MYA-139 / BCRC 22969 / CBS 8797 / KCTC 17520 / NBRC 10181 / NCYC 3082 / Yp74L-3) TaxID=1071383 RepID=J7RSK7_HUIN7|nr:hypothetical protein KNAG_0M00500 [Kazachstania naganishii CBS 8797]CCK72903.1 hypothetical protein KNAG_0M00500 [Kazachstania naganishii CBS 8797]
MCQKHGVRVRKRSQQHTCFIALVSRTPTAAEWPFLCLCAIRAHALQAHTPVLTPFPLAHRFRPQHTFARLLAGWLTQMFNQVRLPPIKTLLDSIERDPDTGNVIPSVVPSVVPRPVLKPTLSQFTPLQGGSKQAVVQLPRPPAVDQGTHPRPGPVPSPQQQQQRGEKCGGSSGRDRKQSRYNLPKDTVLILNRWLLDHLHNPYPTSQEKRELLIKTGLSKIQLSNWFINVRRRKVFSDYYSLANSSDGAAVDPRNIPHRVSDDHQGKEFIQGGVKMPTTRRKKLLDRLNELKKNTRGI